MRPQHRAIRDASAGGNFAGVVEGRLFVVASVIEATWAARATPTLSCLLTALASILGRVSSRKMGAT